MDRHLIAYLLIGALVASMVGVIAYLRHDSFASRDKRRFDRDRRESRSNSDDRLD